MLPLLIRASQEQHVHVILTRPTPELVDLLFPALISIILAGAVAALFQDETKVIKLVLIGLSAPALITSWAGYNLAKDTARDLSNVKTIQNETAPAGASKPANKATVDYRLFPTTRAVFAADDRSNKVATFPHYDPGLIQSLQSSITGAAPTNRDYFVVICATPSEDEAARQRVIAAARFPGEEVALYISPPGYDPVLYSVVVNPNRSFEEATALLKRVSSLGLPSAYIWTFGLPLHPIASENTGTRVSVVLTRINVIHRGAPIPIYWQFDVFANGAGIGRIPLRKFSRDGEVSAPPGSGIIWQSNAFPRRDNVTLRIVGFHRTSLKMADGSTDVRLDNPAGDIVVQATNQVAVLGSFMFYFRVVDSAI